MTLRYQDVVCAFIVKEEDESIASTSSQQLQILCSQRYEDAEHFPAMYEFPGGKVDEGENHFDAVRRECLEELGVQIELLREDSRTNPKPCYSFHHAPKHDKRTGGIVTFRLFFYWAKLIGDQEPKALASQKVCWLTPDEMKGLIFCPGDEGIIEDMNSGKLRPPTQST